MFAFETIKIFDFSLWENKDTMTKLVEEYYFKLPCRYSKRSNWLSGGILNDFCFLKKYHTYPLWSSRPKWIENCQHTLLWEYRIITAILRRVYLARVNFYFEFRADLLRQLTISKNTLRKLSDIIIVVVWCTSISSTNIVAPCDNLVKYLFIREPQ